MSSTTETICTRLIDELDDLSAVSTDLIRSQFEAYRHIPRGEHMDDVREQHRDRLSAIASGEPMSQSALGRAAALARRRAAQGVPVEVLISAYHLGDQELWRRIKALTNPGASSLADVATALLESLHAITTVLAAAHAEVVHALQGHQMTVAHRFIELLDGERFEPEMVVLAEALGWDPRGQFQALVWRRASVNGAAVTGLNAAGPTFADRTVAAQLRGSNIVMCQAVDQAAVQRVRLEGDGLILVGIGRVESGLDGAARSLAGAHRAITASSSRHPVSSLEGDWLMAAILSLREEFSSLLEPVEHVASQNSHLVDAVEAYAECGMSVTATAERLHLHPNSVLYRLERWLTLSGVDARTLEGLVRSLAGCRLSPRR